MSIWAWDKPWNTPDSRMFMGIPKNTDGTGFTRLEAGDEPQVCTYCRLTVSSYPHSHSKAEYDAQGAING